MNWEIRKTEITAKGECEINFRFYHGELIRAHIFMPSGAHEKRGRAFAEPNPSAEPLVSVYFTFALFVRWDGHQRRDGHQRQIVLRFSFIFHFSFGGGGTWKPRDPG